MLVRCMGKLDLVQSFRSVQQNLLAAGTECSSNAQIPNLHFSPPEEASLFDFHSASLDPSASLSTAS